MDSLKRNGLNVNSSPIQPRNTTLGATNNVLRPNMQKLKITQGMVKDNRETRVNNITKGIGSFNSGWINKNK